MRWIMAKPKRAIPNAVKLALLRRALAEQPESVACLTNLGDALAATRDFAAAAESYGMALALDPDGFSSWNMFARCELNLGRLATVLDLCDNAEAYGSSGEICCIRGRALAKLGQPDAARAQFTRALALGDCGLVPLKKLLEPLAWEEGGGALEEFCDALARPWRDTALVRAHRAIALSRQGRVAEARRIIDLDRHIWRVEIALPTRFADIAEFNSVLAREIQAGPEPAHSGRDGFDLTSRPPHDGKPAHLALFAIIRDAMTQYLAQAQDRALADILPSAPTTALLHHNNLVLRNDAANGEHIHGRGLVSAVYHVAVPAAVTHAEDHRGSLVLGPCMEMTRGHEGCWGKRFIKPIPGWLILFPSHIFHDVIPTRTNDPRISVVADMWPV